MKKMIIYMPKLSIGGMEKALINLLKIGKWTDKYDITLFLGYYTDKKLLEMLPNNVHVYVCNRGKWNVFGKINTFIKMYFQMIKLFLGIKKYDVAISYAYQHPILATLTRMSSDNNIIFIHNNLKLKMKNNKKRYKKMKFDQFKKIVCVSNEAKKIFLELYPNYLGAVTCINNYIDGDDIIKKASEPIEFNYQKPVFISIARCEERSKKISRIIDCSKKIVDEGFNFSVLIIGDGEDFNLYKRMVKLKKIEDTVHLLGRKINPYCYLKHSDALVLSSEYEGYGIVIDEARILNIPVISTDVADAKKILDDGYGILCENSENGIYKGMKEFLEKGYKIKNKFSYLKFNENIDKKLEKIIEE